MSKKYIMEIKIKNQNFLTYIAGVLEHIVGSKLDERILCFLITRNLSDEIKEDLMHVTDVPKNDHKKLVDILQDLDNRRRRIDSQESPDR